MLTPETLRLRIAALRKKRNDVGLSFAENVELLKSERALQLYSEAAKSEAIAESRQVNHHHRTNPHE